MERHTEVIDMPNFSMAIPSEASNCRSLSDENKVCPLCHSEVSLFYINMDEKILMCRNVQCDYPFGSEDIEIFKDNDDLQCDEELASVPSKASFFSPTATCSLTSTASWNQNLNRVYQEANTENCTFNKRLEKNIEEKNNRAQIQKSISELRKLYSELQRQEDDKTNLKNEKWIKNLKKLQEMSGCPLLKPEEISLLKADEPIIGNGELKIDIDNRNSVSLINIQITNNDHDNAVYKSDQVAIDNVRDDLNTLVKSQSPFLGNTEVHNNNEKFDQNNVENSDCITVIAEENERNSHVSDKNEFTNKVFGVNEEINKVSDDTENEIKLIVNNPITNYAVSNTAMNMEPGDSHCAENNVANSLTEQVPNTAINMESNDYHCTENNVDHILIQQDNRVNNIHNEDNNAEDESPDNVKNCSNDLKNVEINDETDDDTCIVYVIVECEDEITDEEIPTQQ